MERRSSQWVVPVLGHFTFLVLLALAWKHADLRTAFGDSAFQVFKWVNNAGLSVEAHRYAAILPQVAVKLCKALGAGLASLLLVASLAHVLVAYAIFLMCLHVLKAPATAVATLVAAVLCTRLTFYGPVVEANYLLSYPFLFIGMLERHGPVRMTMRQGALLSLTGALTLLVHPLGWLLLVFGVLFLWAMQRLLHREAGLLLAGLAAGAGAVRLLFPPTTYEQGQYGKLFSERLSWATFGEWGSSEFLWGHTFTLTTNYLPALVLLLLVLGAWWLRGRKLGAGVLLSGVLGYLTLALVTFRDGDSAIMMDRAFLPLATLIALPAAFLFAELRGRRRIVACAVLALVLFIKLRDISFASRDLRKQYTRIEELVKEVQKQGLAKVDAQQSEMDDRGIRADWALPFTTLLISAREGPYNAITVRVSNPLGGSSSAPRLDEVAPVLAPHYFRLPDTPYTPFANERRDP